MVYCLLWSYQVRTGWGGCTEEQKRQLWGCQPQVFPVAWAGGWLKHSRESEAETVMIPHTLRRWDIVELRLRKVKVSEEGTRLRELNLQMSCNPSCWEHSKRPPSHRRGSELGALTPDAHSYNPGCWLRVWWHSRSPARSPLLSKPSGHRLSSLGLTQKHLALQGSERVPHKDAALCPVTMSPWTEPKEPSADLSHL
jgi:hypothetical protein